MSWPQQVCAALDKAIATVAKREYKRLSKGKGSDEIRTCVEKALRELEKLQQGKPSDYHNEWVALFYMTWYQPRQINLALSIFKKFFRPDVSDRSLHIIDVGCGALAVQFAAAIAKAAAEKRQTRAINITVQGIDPSKSMRKIGEELWQEFWYYVFDVGPTLRYLANACDVMASSCSSCDTYCQVVDTKAQGNPSPDECWLIAMHAVYETNQEDIKKCLKDIRQKQQHIDVDVVTSYRHPDRINVVKGVCPSDFKEVSLPPLAQEWRDSQDFQRTTKWRRNLVPRLCPWSADSMVFDYLGREVQGNRQDAVAIGGRFPIDNTAIFQP